MPRELVHWEVLLSCIAAFRAQAPKLCAALSECPAAAQWGALAPDAPYYHRFGGSTYESIAEAIHGSGGEDTYDVPRTILSRSDAAAEVAFAFGFLSHCVVDAVFHPMIYFFTGNYYHEDPGERLHARRRHRALEVYIDRYWKTHFCSQAANAFSLARVYREVSPQLGRITQALGSAIPASTALIWQESFRDYYRSTRLCTNWGSGLLLTLFNRLVDRRFQAEQALLSFGRHRVPDWLEQNLQYKNPATGSDVQQSLADLRQQARGTLIALATEVEQFLAASAEQRREMPFSRRVGPSLNSGLIGSHKADMQHFAPREVS